MNDSNEKENLRREVKESYDRRIQRSINDGKMKDWMKPVTSIHITLEHQLDEKLQSELFDRVDKMLNKLLSLKEFDKMFEENDVIYKTANKEEDHVKLGDLVVMGQLDWSEAEPISLFDRQYKFEGSKLSIELSPNLEAIKEQLPNVESQAAFQKKAIQVVQYLNPSTWLLFLINKKKYNATQEVAQDIASEMALKSVSNAVSYTIRRYLRESFKAMENPTVEEKGQLNKSVTKEVQSLTKSNIKFKVS